MDFFDESTAASLGQLVGADTLFTADYNISKVSSEGFTKEGKKCVNSEAHGGLMGNLGATKCTEYRPITINCIKKVAVVNLTPKATNVNT